MMLWALLVLGTAFRLPLFLRVKPYCEDEWHSITTALLPWMDTVKTICLDNHPPFYFLLLHGFIRVFGFDPWSIEALSLIPSVLSIVSVFYLADELFDKKTAFYAGLLTAISPYLVHLSNEVRNHGLPVFLCSVSALFFFKSLKNPGSKTFKILYVLLAWAALGTSHFVWFWFIGIAAFQIAGKYRFSQWPVILGGLPSLALLLWQGLSHHELHYSNLSDYWDGGRYFWEWLTRMPGLWKHMVAGQDIYVIDPSSESPQSMAWRMLYKIISLAVFYASFLAFKKLHKENRPLFLLFFLMCFFPVLAIWIGNPYRMDPRYFGFAVPFFMILVAYGYNQIRSTAIKTAFAAVLLCWNLAANHAAWVLNKDMLHPEFVVDVIEYVFPRAGTNDAILHLTEADLFYIKHKKLKSSSNIFIKDFDGLKKIDLTNIKKIWYVAPPDTSTPYDAQIQVPAYLKPYGFHEKHMEFGSIQGRCYLIIFERN